MVNSRLIAECRTSGIPAKEGVMAEDIQAKLEKYRTAPFDARFPNANQTRNCWQNYLDYHRCQKSLTNKGVDIAPCDWYKRVYKSLCPMSWIAKWDDQRDEGTFPGKI
ncbi:hypothetical protein COCON_G00030580 [Conger conger]|uniref:Cytochrome c oxidase subunit 6B1 n=2 Tax=Conger conger TaxID=82655 RepID=A0A9Q1DYN2_CONCO|nr:hypothetical protein COCON_G00030580 [Conger conger]